MKKRKKKVTKRSKSLSSSYWKHGLTVTLIVTATHTFSISRSCHKYHFCCDKHVFVVTKHVFCCDKSMLAATKDVFCRNKLVTCLSWQNVCHDKKYTCGSSYWWYTFQASWQTCQQQHWMDSPGRGARWCYTTDKQSGGKLEGCTVPAQSGAPALRTRSSPAFVSTVSLLSLFLLWSSS